MFTFNAPESFMFVSAVLVKSLFLFTGTALAVLVLRRSSASHRALAWQMCLFGMLLLPTLSAVLPSMRISVPNRTQSSESADPVMRLPLPAQSNISNSSVRTGVGTVIIAPDPPGAHPTPVRATPMVSPGKHEEVRRIPIDVLAGITWTFGALLLLVRLGISSWLLLRLRRTSIDAPSAVCHLGGSIARECCIRRTVRFMIAPDAASSTSPMTWGWMRPVILFPADAADWNVDRLRSVMLHELGHVARLDWPAHILADLAASLYWFYPLAWIMRRRLRIECEQACDDSVLAYGIEPRAYATLLVDIARLNLDRKRAPILANSIAMHSGARSLMATRVAAVLQTGLPRRRISGAAAASGLLLVVLLVSPLSAARLVRAAKGTAQPGILARQSAANPADGGPFEYFRANGESGLEETAGHTALSKPDFMPLRSAPPVDSDYLARDGAKAAGVMRADLQSVHWGPIRYGLQAGICVRTHGHVFKAGERVELDSYIRNASNSDIAFSFGNHSYYEQMPEVWDESKPGSPRKLEVRGVVLTGIDPAFSVLLKPGEAVNFFNPGLGLGEKQALPAGVQKTGIEQFPYLANPGAGRYSVMQTVLVHLIKREQVRELAPQIRSQRKPNTRQHTLRVIGADGLVYDRESSVTMLQQDARAITSMPDMFLVGAAPSATGPASPANREEGEIAWGKPESGLQAGLRSPGNRRRFRIGEIVEMEYIVKNAGDKPITFKHEVTPGVAGVISDIVDSSGKPAYTIGEPVLHTSEMREVTLKPGAMTVIGNTQMGVELPRSSSNDQQRRSGATNWVEAAPGNYQIRHLDTLYLEGEDSGNVTLYTGYLPLDIQARAISAVWGKAINGLRAGIALHENTRQIIGKQVLTDLYINNVSAHNITIRYISNNDKFFVPELWNAQRKLLPPDWKNGTVELKLEATRELKPGESECVAHPYFTIARRSYTLAEENQAELDEATLFLGRPGSYVMRMTAALIMNPLTDLTKWQRRDPKDEKTIWGYFPSGEISIELAAL